MEKKKGWLVEKVRGKKKGRGKIRKWLSKLRLCRLPPLPRRLSPPVEIGVVVSEERGGRER